MNLEELKTEKDRAYKAAYKAEQDFSALRQSKINEATKIIDEELTPQREERNKLRRLSAEANIAVENKLIELAQEGNQCKYALGTKLQKMQRKFGYCHYRPAETIIYGIIEVVTRDTVFPDNTASWRRPSPGSLIVRICTKDGKPGKKFVKWTEYEASQWKPVE